MKREIKLRIKDTDTNTYITGGLLDEKIKDYLGNVLNLSSLEVYQYIGLKDKNGTEIFEGDLLADRYPIDDEDESKGYYTSYLPVVWDDKKLMWSVDGSFKKDGSYLTSLVEYFGEFLEVKADE